MNSSPKVSIIVPVYRAESYLTQCIESILHQTYSNIELLLVDDASPDLCPKICDKFSTRDHRIKVIHQKNRGAALARETGLKAATGEYALFVDCDDWIDPATVSVCMDRAQTDSADCILFDYIREYADHSIENFLFSREFSYDLVESEQLIHRRIVGMTAEELTAPQRIDNLSSMCMKLFHIDAARKGRIVSDRIVGTSEDTLFNLYALENCKISYIHQCFYHYRKTNAQSITTQHKADLSEKWDVMYKIFQEYVENSGRADVYWPVFLNRVACGIIGLGLNEVGSSAGMRNKARKLKLILNKPLYREAFAQLDITYCPLKWKVFFLLCKKRMTLPLAGLLQLMNYLRSRMAA